MTAPTMADIEATPWNGLTVASMFAGWGGSSLGYRMAGYRVAYANEIDRKAADAYEHNSSVEVDRRSIEDVRGEEIREAVGGGLDILDGSPPCQGFSSAAGSKRLDDPTAIGYRDLYWRFAQRILEARPRAFVAENVTGLTRDPWRLMYLHPVREWLREAGYRVEYEVIDGSLLGVPQTRKRVLLVGLRDDVGADPVDVFAGVLQRETVRRATLGDVIPEATAWAMKPEPGGIGSYKERQQKATTSGMPVPTLCAYGMERTPRDWIRVETRDGRERRPTFEDLTAISGFPADYALPDGVGLTAAWKGFGNSVPPPMAAAWAAAIRDALLGAS